MSAPDKIARAQELAQSGTVGSLLDQADSLLDRAIGQLRSAAGLSDRDAAVCIAVISELRGAASRANREIIKGTEAGQDLTATNTTNNLMSDR